MAAVSATLSSTGASWLLWNVAADDQGRLARFGRKDLSGEVYVLEDGATVPWYHQGADGWRLVDQGAGLRGGIADLPPWMAGEFGASWRAPAKV